MISRVIKYFSCLILMGMLAVACSNKKNTTMSRAYQNLTSHYNVYFNAKESFKSGVAQVDESHIDNYANILPIFKYGTFEAVSNASGAMDKTIKKCSKLIKLHSIKAKPKRGKGEMSKRQLEFYKKKEFNNWVDNTYLLTGKAQFYMHEFEFAIKAFEYVIREYSSNPIAYEAKVWLVRAYNEIGQYKDAESLINQLEEDNDLPKKYKSELITLYADNFLKQNNYESAIPKLILTIDKTRKKKLRARYSFILAQVYERIKDENNAYEMYSSVIKLSPHYEMAFNAKINRANLLNADGNMGEDIRSQLQRMLKDDKNIEFRDQIYYALGNVALKDENKEEALENFVNSVFTSVFNTNQKGVSSIKAADLYFENNNYELARNYYDSALLFLDESYPGYIDIYRETKTLNRLVSGLHNVEVEDSLQKIAKMDSRKRDQLIAELVEKAREEELRIREMKDTERRGNLLLNRGGGSYRENANNSRNTGGGGWYFYNPSTKSFGLQEFQRKWGKNVKLSDNWRRSNKQNFSEDEEDEEKNEEEEMADDLLVRRQESKFDKTDSKYYMENVPMTDSAMQVSNDLIKKALFIVGRIYYKDIKDYDKAISAFEDLNERYIDHEFLLESYYNLYQLYMLKNSPVQAKKYKDLILEKFPKSTYAKMLVNPNYYKELEADRKKVHKLYEETYQHFNNGNYSSVIKNCDYAEDYYPDNDIKVKFSYIKTLATGKMASVRTFKSALEQFIVNHPKGKEKKAADNILAYIESMGLKIDFYEELEAEIRKDSIENEIVPVDTAALEEIYSLDENANHFFAILINSKNIDGAQLIFNIINHNIDFFPQLDFNTLSEKINDEYQIITVEPFINKENAMEYYVSAEQNQNLFKDIDKGDYQFFIISDENLDIFKKEKALNEYLDFFNYYYKQ